MKDNELKTIYDGYIGEDEFQKSIISNLKGTDIKDINTISDKMEYSLSPYVLIRLCDAYKDDDKVLNNKIELLLEDCNFHEEAKMLRNGDIDEMLSKEKDSIEQYVEDSLLEYFEEAYFQTDGNISIDDLTNAGYSNAETKFLEDKGFITFQNNKYTLSDEYKLGLKDGEKSMKEYLFDDLVEQIVDLHYRYDKESFMDNYDNLDSAFYDFSLALENNPQVILDGLNPLIDDLKTNDKFAYEQAMGIYSMVENYCKDLSKSSDDYEI